MAINFPPTRESEFCFGDQDQRTDMSRILYISDRFIRLCAIQKNIPENIPISGKFPGIFPGIFPPKDYSREHSNPKKLKRKCNFS